MSLRRPLLEPDFVKQHDKTDECYEGADHGFMRLAGEFGDTNPDNRTAAIKLCNGLIEIVGRFHCLGCRRSGAAHCLILRSVEPIHGRGDGRDVRRAGAIEHEHCTQVFARRRKREGFPPAPGLRELFSQVRVTLPLFGNCFPDGL
jgi:hypothetical protein